VSKEYRERFFAIIEELAKVLDALEVRLSKRSRLSAPGADTLRKKLSLLLLEISKKNSLTISGRLSFPELLEYSLGVSSEFCTLTKAICALLPNSPISYVEEEPFASASRIAAAEMGPKIEPGAL